MQEDTYKGVGEHLAKYSLSSDGGDVPDDAYRAAVWQLAWAVAALPEPESEPDAAWYPERPEVYWLAKGLLFRIVAEAGQGALDPPAVVHVDARPLDSPEWRIGFESHYETNGKQQVFKKRWSFRDAGDEFLSIEGRVDYDRQGEWEPDGAERFACLLAERIRWPALERKLRHH